MLLTNKKLFLLDGMSLIYRAYFAFSKTSPTTTSGLKTGAILGFTNTLVEILQKEKPTHIAVAFDAKGDNFRHELFPAYKSHRQKQPEDLSIAIPYIKNILDGFGIHHLASMGYEADDLLGTLATQAKIHGYTTYIMSTDKDLAQIIEDKIYLYKPASNGNKSTILGKKEILAAWGIERTEQVVDILALTGDPSDFIPGIPSIGKKTAQKLIHTFDNLENLLANAHHLPGKTQQLLMEYTEQAILSKKLATICRAVPLTLDLDACRYQDADRTILEPIFELLEFKGLTKRLFSEQNTHSRYQPTTTPTLFDKVEAPHTGENNETDKTKPYLSVPPGVAYIFVDNLVDAQQLIEKLHKEKIWSFDATIADTNPHIGALLGLSFCYKPGVAYYISLPNDASAQHLLLSYLQPLLANKQTIKIGHNLKSQCIALQRHGLNISPPLFDTMIAHALIAPAVQHTLSNLAQKYLHHTFIPIEERIGNQRACFQNMTAVLLEQVASYTSEKADIILQLYSKLHVVLEEENVQELFYQIEMPLVPVLLDMEMEGVGIDVPFLKKLSQSMQEHVEKLKEQIYILAGTPFNINSPKQLGEVLFNTLQLHKAPTKTTKGQYATGEEILSKLSKAHPIVELIMEYRVVQKLLSNYVDKLPSMVHPIDHKIHTCYQQAVVSTGRLSSTEPNLQNIPIKTEIGKSIRKAFIPHHPEDLLFTADYSQIELRIMAAYAQDATMIMAFEQDLDIHTLTASKLFKIPLHEVDDAMRRKAKTVNFGVIYGISAFGLAQRIEQLSRKEAAQWIQNYFEEFPAIRTYMNNMIAYAQEQGYVTTMLGRKRFLPDIHSRNATVRGFAERNAINTPIQGSAAEMIKLAMIDIHSWLQKEKLTSRMIMQVHDELVLNVPKEEIQQIQEQVPLLMIHALPLKNVPIKVHSAIRLNWLEQLTQ